MQFSGFNIAWTLSNLYHKEFRDINFELFTLYAEMKPLNTPKETDFITNIDNNNSQAFILKFWS